MWVWGDGVGSGGDGRAGGGTWGQWGDAESDSEFPDQIKDQFGFPFSFLLYQRDTLEGCSMMNRRSW